MPLRAELKDKILFSFKVSLDEWNELKGSDSRKLLTLPCCGNRAIAKTSPLGTQFFSHHRKSKDCISKPESKEHLRLKALVASAAESVGWDVTTEFIGESLKGEKWIADVYCTKGKAKVALEIQLSQQTKGELGARHKRYVESGVRDGWLMEENVYKNSGYSSQKAFPRFGVKNIEEDRAPLMSDYEITVEQFVKKLLTGGLEWKEDIDSEVIYYMKSICWKCSKGLKIPVGIGNNENSNFDDFIKTVPNCSTFYEKLIKQLGGSELERLGLTTIGPNPHMKGNAPRFPFCVKCTRCYAPQSNHHTLKSFTYWVKNNDSESHYVIHTRYYNNGRYELKK
tara:strand:+ start:582 stop:1598 length:1017 start_codon:yes stop_codon:yes gene_type:complete